MDYTFLQDHIFKQVAWITSHEGHEEAVKLLSLLENSFHPLEKAIRHIDEKEYDEAIKLLKNIIEVNRHRYLFTSIFVVQAAIYGRDALRLAGRNSECLDWTINALSTIEIQEPELRYVDDLAEMYQLLMEEWDVDPKRVVQEIMQIKNRAQQRKQKDTFSEGMAELALSHLSVLEGNFVEARSHFECSESLINVNSESLVRAMRYCLLAEIEGNTGHFDKATKAAKEAEKIYRERGRTAYAFSLARDQGQLFFLQSAWSQAGDAFKRAIEDGNDLYRTALMKEDKEDWLSNAGALFRQAGYSLARDGQLQDAVVCLEQGRARGLGDAMARDYADLERVRSLNPHAYEKYKNAIGKIQELDKPGLSGPVSKIKEDVRQARTELKDAIELIRELEGYKGFLQESNFADIVTAVELGQPIIYLIVTDFGSLALILYRKSIASEVTIEPLWFNEFTQNELRELLIGPTPRKSIEGWFGAYQRLRNNHQSQQARQGWLNEIDNVTQKLWELIGPIEKRLRNMGMRKAVLIPGGLLALLPLHAAWTENGDSRKYVLDNITFTYAPSSLVLCHARRIEKSAQAEKLLAISNPDGSIADSQEMKGITLFFNNTTELIRRRDVLDALPYAQVVHFDCHGRANLKDAAKSFLVMADREYLMAEDLLQINLNQQNRTNGRLVTLSACETGIVSAFLPDEVVGFPGTFMRAGFAGVVASLWIVNVKSTAELMKYFYMKWRQEKLSPSEALREAQLWLRSPSHKGKFEHPYYWAAFYFMGV